MSSLKTAIVELNDLVDVIREGLNVISRQRSTNQVKKTEIKTKGSFVSKLVACGKNCSGCPHGPYLHQVSRVNGKQVWKYIGRRADGKDDSGASQKRS